MKPGKHKLTIYQGATFRPSFTWKAGTPSALVDLTGWKARLQIRATKESATAIADLTTENGGIVLGGPAGTIRLRMSATATAALTFESAVYDLELEAPDGDVWRLLEGSVALSKGVTR